MIDFKNVEIWYIFGLIFFLTFLYKIEEMVEEETYKTKSRKVLFLLTTTSTLVAAIVGTVCWVTLEDMKIKFMLFDISIQLKGWVNVFISITIPFFYKEMILAVKRKMIIIATKE
jgi:hypothetical protein